MTTARQERAPDALGPGASLSPAKGPVASIPVRPEVDSSMVVENDYRED
jgi:hypothetical protein